nr:Retrovirus-related Pol polyprotein from transposon TNT 1-94 [Ipomoea batatas]
MFKVFKPITEGEQVFMGNSSVSEVSGKGKIELMLYSGKKLMLRDVLYVPSLRRNLISGALLNKAGIKLVFESNRLVMTLCGQYLGKGYLQGGLFVLDVSESLVLPPSLVASLACGLLKNWAKGLTNPRCRCDEPRAPFPRRLLLPSGITEESDGRPVPLTSSAIASRKGEYRHLLPREELAGDYPPPSLLFCSPAVEPRRSEFRMLVAVDEPETATIGEVVAVLAVDKEEGDRVSSPP